MHVTQTIVQVHRASPDLVKVLVEVQRRARGSEATIPLSVRYDSSDRVVGSPLPHLFARLELPTGANVTLLDVTGAFGPPLPSQVEIEAPGEEWNHPLTPGVHYLIPYSQPGLTSQACDPVFEVPEADMPALVAASEAGLWPRTNDAPAHELGVLLQEPTPSPEAEPAVAPGQAPRGGWPLLVGSLVGGAVVLALLRSLMGRRRADRAVIRPLV